MSCLCESRLFLGCVKHCDQIPKDFESEVEGTHKLFYEHPSGALMCTEFDAMKCIPFRIWNKFPECANIHFYIEKPDGTKLTLIEDGITYECFWFKNKVGFAVA